MEVNLATAERRPPTGEGWAVRFLAVDLAPTVGEKRGRWDLVRGLRNETAHAHIRHLRPPHEALRVLELLAAEIGALFAPEPRLDTNAAL